MDETVLYVTTNHPFYPRSGAGITGPVTGAIVQCPMVIGQRKLQSYNSYKYSMPLIDYGRNYKVDVDSVTGNELSGYLHDQTLPEMRATHIMKDYPVFLKSPGSTINIEDFYMELQCIRRKYNDRKQLLVEPAMYITDNKPTAHDFLSSNKENWYTSLDNLYKKAKSQLEEPADKKADCFYVSGHAR